MKKQKVYIPTTDKEGFTHIISDQSKNEICGAREEEKYCFTDDELKKYTKEILQGGIEIGKHNYHYGQMSVAKKNYIESLNIN